MAPHSVLLSLACEFVMAQGAGAVSEAANAIVQAVNQAVASSPAVVSAESLAELKHLHGLNTKAVDELKLVGEQLKGLHAVNTKMVESMARMERQLRVQTLLAAIQNCESNDFVYYQGQYHNDSKRSGQLVASILHSFIKDFGCFSPLNAVLEGDRGQGSGELPAAEQRFREHLQNQIHMLIGSKPRLEQNEDGRYVFYPPVNTHK